MKYSFREKTYYIFTLGCQMNENDSERIATVLESLNFSPTSENEADLIIANLCSVRQKGIDRVWGHLRNWKKRTPKPSVYLTGCILKGDRAKFEKRVDGVFNIADLAHFPTLLKKDKLIKSSNSLSYLDIIPKRANHDSVFVPIMTGCNNFCSYCAVPYTRGREISRPKAEVISEVKNLIKRDCKYILLLGQNVNSYNSKGKSRSNFDNSDFIDLLKSIDKLPGKFEFSFMSSNPHDMSDELIDTFSRLKKWDKTLHVAMQSGDDRILKKMNRKCKSTQFLALTKKIRAKVPGIILSTDIIVGFPSETKKAFENTIKACEQAKFDKAYISQYSERAGTMSAKKYKDDVPRLEKKRRWKVLDNLIN